MAIHLSQVLGNYSKTTRFIDFVEEYIDSKMCDPNYVKDWRCGPENHAFYRFAVAGTASEGDKQEIARRYTQAGWGEVICGNSGENGERPGMFGVVLYQTSKAATDAAMNKG